jgi:MFS family permease
VGRALRLRALGAFAVFGLFWGGWAALVPLVQSDVGASKGALGTALLGIAVGALPAMAATGRAVDRHGTRVVPVALAVFAVAAVLPAFAWSVPSLTVALLALGVGTGSVDVALNAEAAAIEDASGRPLMQLAHALFSAGVIVGSVGVGLARQLGAGRVPILSVLALVIAASAVPWRGAPQRAPVPRAPARIQRALLLIGLVCAGAFVVEGGMESWSALYLERVLDAAPVVSGLGPGCFALAMVAGRLSGHRLEGRVGGGTLLAAGGAVAAAGLVLASRAPSIPVALLGFLAAGAGVSVAAPLLFGAAGRGASGAERGSAVATVTTVSYLGFLVGPPLMGGTSQALSLRAAFLVLAGAAALVAVTARRLPLLDR